MTNDELLTKLNAEPTLRDRICNILEIVSNTDDKFDLADIAELQVIKELQNLGHEALEAWANYAEQTHQEVAITATGSRKHGKKSSLEDRLRTL